MTSSFDSWIYPKDFIKVTFADKVAPSCAPAFQDEGFSVDTALRLPKDDLMKHLIDKHVVGIRSKTHFHEADLDQLPNLLTIGCFCIGTDQVDLTAAANHGVAVFNAPFGNTRSVAELILSNIVQLARKAGDRNIECHKGIWGKTHIGCHEIRGKKLGVIGYGHVGTQVSILAEAFGMKVYYYDINPKLPLGNANPVSSLNELLATVDFVTLHVPFTELTHNMITTKEISRMKKGSYLLNAARGKVVVLEDVAEAIKSGHLAGAYFDVYPTEPLDAENPLCGLPNVILSPHIGGSTMEAQENIGRDCCHKIINYITEGSTVGSVNFPEASLPTRKNCHRIVNIHRNVPGVLKQINAILADYNVVAQILSTRGDIGYLIVDLDGSTKLSVVVKEKLDLLGASIKTRVIWKAGMYSQSATPEPDEGYLEEALQMNIRGSMPKSLSSDRLNLQTINEGFEGSRRKASVEEEVILLDDDVVTIAV